jgi:hypothetical protein
LGKILSLTFAVIAVLMLMGVGIALSYRALWLALLLSLATLFIIGFGFILKARLRR